MKAASKPKATPTRSGDDGARLLAAVLEQPHDLSIRSVYGDWLSERGDPRGEVIALQGKGEQASKEDRKRLDALLSAHGEKWLSPIDEIVREPRFRLGFLSGCSMVKLYSQAHRALLAHPLLSTLEDAGRDESGEVVTGPGLRSVRRVSTRLAASPTWPRLHTNFHSRKPSSRFTSMGLPGASGASKARSICSTRTRTGPRSRRSECLVRQLRTLGFDAHGSDSVCRPEQYAWLLDSPLVRQLRRLRLERCTKRWVHLGHWLKVLERFPNLEQLNFSFASWEGQPSGRGHEQRMLVTRAGKKGLEVLMELTNRADQLVPQVFQRVMQSGLAEVPASFPSQISVRLTGSRKTKQQLTHVRSDIEAVLGCHFKSVQFEEPGFDLS